MPEICTMMKAKDADAKKIPLHETIYLEEKIDGVPGVIVISQTKAVTISRQGKAVTSIPHIQEALLKLMQETEATQYPLVGEIKVPELPFEESAGVTRAKKVDDRQVFHLFDIQNNQPYAARRIVMDTIAKAAGAHGMTCICRPTQYGKTVCHSREEAELLIKMVHATVVEKHLEGMMLRTAKGLYFVGKRSWDMQRVVLTPTIDLRVVGFEEAKSAGGARLGMVGKVIVERNGGTEGVGPGKLTHDERRALWTEYVCTQAYGGWKPRIAKIKYKGGETANYKSLRQATFQCWHGDKSEPDA